MKGDDKETIVGSASIDSFRFRILSTKVFFEGIEY